MFWLKVYPKNLINQQQGYVATRRNGGLVLEFANQIQPLTPHRAPRLIIQLIYKMEAIHILLMLAAATFVKSAELTNLINISTTAVSSFGLDSDHSYSYSYSYTDPLVLLDGQHDTYVHFTDTSEYNYIQFDFSESTTVRTVLVNYYIGQYADRYGYFRLWVGNTPASNSAYTQSNILCTSQQGVAGYFQCLGNGRYLIVQQDPNSSQGAYFSNILAYSDAERGSGGTAVLHTGTTIQDGLTHSFLGFDPTGDTKCVNLQSSSDNIYQIRVTPPAALAVSHVQLLPEYDSSINADVTVTLVRSGHADYVCGVILKDQNRDLDRTVACSNNLADSIIIEFDSTISGPSGVCKIGIFTACSESLTSVTSSFTDPGLSINILTQTTSIVTLPSISTDPPGCYPVTSWAILDEDDNDFSPFFAWDFPGGRLNLSINPTDTTQRMILFGTNGSRTLKIQATISADTPQYEDNQFYVTFTDPCRTATIVPSPQTLVTHLGSASVDSQQIVVYEDSVSQQTQYASDICGRKTFAPSVSAPLWFSIAYGTGQNYLELKFDHSSTSEADIGTYDFQIVVESELYSSIAGFSQEITVYACAFSPISGPVSPSSLTYSTAELLTVSFTKPTLSYNPGGGCYTVTGESVLENREVNDALTIAISTVNNSFSITHTDKGVTGTFDYYFILQLSSGLDFESQPFMITYENPCLLTSIYDLNVIVPIVSPSQTGSYVERNIFLANSVSDDRNVDFYCGTYSVTWLTSNLPNGVELLTHESDQSYITIKLNTDLLNSEQTVFVDVSVSLAEPAYNRVGEKNGTITVPIRDTCETVQTVFAATNTISADLTMAVTESARVPFIQFPTDALCKFDADYLVTLVPMQTASDQIPSELQAQDILGRQPVADLVSFDVQTSELVIAPNGDTSLANSTYAVFLWAKISALQETWDGFALPFRLSFEPLPDSSNSLANYNSASDETDNKAATDPALFEYTGGLAPNQPPTILDLVVEATAVPEVATTVRVGHIVDPEGDSFSVSLIEARRADLDEVYRPLDWIFLRTGTGAEDFTLLVKAPLSVAGQQYQVRFELADDNKDSVSAHFSFLLSVQAVAEEPSGGKLAQQQKPVETAEEEERWQPPEQKQEPDAEVTVYKVRPMQATETGQIQVVFESPIKILFSIRNWSSENDGRSMIEVHFQQSELTMETLVNYKKTQFFKWFVREVIVEDQSDQGSRRLQVEASGEVLNVKSFKIELEFGEPLYVSQEEEPDRLTVQILPQLLRWHFTSKQLAMMDLSELYKKQDITLPNILTAEQEQLIEKTEEATTTVVVTAIALGLFSQLFSSYVIQYMWGFVNTLQIIVMTVLFSVVQPQNSSRVLISVLSLVNFDILHTENIINAIVQFDARNEPLNAKFAQVKYDSSNFIVGTGDIAATLIVCLGYLLVRALVLYLSRRLGSDHNCLARRFKGKINYSIAALRFLLEGCLELGIVTLLAVRGLNRSDFATPQDAVSTTIALITLVLLCLAPVRLVLISYRLRKKPESLTPERLAEQKELFEAYRENDGYSMAYGVMFFLRRYFMVVLLVLCPEQRYAQICCQLASTLVMMMYIGYFRPYRSRNTNRQELANEVFAIVGAYHLYAFTDHVVEKRIQRETGWSLVAVLLSCVFFNFVFIASASFRKAYRRIKTAKRKREACTKYQERAFERIKGDVPRAGEPVPSDSRLDCDWSSKPGSQLKVSSGSKDPEDPPTRPSRALMVKQMAAKTAKRQHRRKKTMVPARMRAQRATKNRKGDRPATHVQMKCKARGRSARKDLDSFGLEACPESAEPSIGQLEKDYQDVLHGVIGRLGTPVQEERKEDRELKSSTATPWIGRHAMSGDQFDMFMADALSCIADQQGREKH